MGVKDRILCVLRAPLLQF